MSDDAQSKDQKKPTGIADLDQLPKDRRITRTMLEIVEQTTTKDELLAKR